MKSKIFLLILSLFITISAIAGVTYAWFTDSVSSVSNTFAAGTVDIQVISANGDLYLGPMFYTTVDEGKALNGEADYNHTGLWKPGASHMRVLIVKNTGSLNARIFLVGAEITSINGSQFFDGTLKNLLANNMHIKIYDEINEIVLFDGTLNNLLNGYRLEDNIKASLTLNSPNGQRILKYTVTLRESAGNELQGIKAVIDFWVGVEQAANNQ